MANPWDRREDEPKQAYAAFVAFRDLGPKRTLIGAYRGAYKGPKRVSAVPGNYRDRAKRFDWIGRAKAWDERLAAVAEKEAAKATRSQARKWARRNEQWRELLWAPIRMTIRHRLKIEAEIAETGEAPDPAVIHKLNALIGEVEPFATRAGLGSTVGNSDGATPRLVIPTTDDRATDRGSVE